MGTLKLSGIAFCSGLMLLTSQARAYTFQNPAGNPAYALSGGCVNISSPGIYTLKADMLRAYTPCLSVTDTRDVLIRCEGRAVAGIRVSNSRNFAIRGCKLTASGGGTALEITGSADGEILSNTVGDPALGTALAIVSSSANVTLKSNAFWGRLELNYAERTAVSQNTFGGTLYSTPWEPRRQLISRFGSYNTVSSNTFDGAIFYSPSVSAVLVQDEHHATVLLNTFRNAARAVELAGRIFKGRIERNQIQASEFAIGGYDNLSVIASRIVGNTLDSSAAIWFRRRYGLRLGGFDPLGKMLPDPGVYFQSNVIEGNKILGTGWTSVSIPVYDRMGYAGDIGPGIELTPSDSQFYLTGNSVGANDFGSTAPDFGRPTYAGIVIDKGGNLCAPPFAPSMHPLSCDPLVLPPVYPKAVFPVARKRIFVSSTRISGSAGGLSGADSTCATTAEKAGLEGKWMALLSTSTRSLASRVTIAGPWYLVNDPLGLPSPVFADRASIAAGPQRPLTVDERGGTYLGMVFTGATGSGDPMPGFDCSGWTSELGWGAFGYASAIGSAALGGQATTCVERLPIYCMER